MKIIAFLLTMTVLTLNVQAMDQSPSKLLNFEQTTKALETLTQNSSSQLTTAQKLQIMKLSKELLEHTDSLITAYENLALKHMKKSEELNSSAMHALEKIKQLNKNRKNLVSQLRGFSSLGNVQRLNTQAELMEFPTIKKLHSDIVVYLE